MVLGAFKNHTKTIINSETPNFICFQPVVFQRLVFRKVAIESSRAFMNVEW